MYAWHIFIIDTPAENPECMHVKTNVNKQRKVLLRALFSRFIQMRDISP